MENSTITVKVAKSIGELDPQKQKAFSALHCTKLTLVLEAGSSPYSCGFLRGKKKPHVDEVNSNLKQNTMELALFWSKYKEINLGEVCPEMKYIHTP